MSETEIKGVYKCPICGVIDNDRLKMNIEQLRKELKIDEGVKYESLS